MTVPRKGGGLLRTDRWRFVLLLAFLAGVTALLYLHRDLLLELFGSSERLREWVESFGPWGPLASIGLGALQVILAPLPGQAIGVANGYLYGPWLGLLYSMVGLILGTGIAIAVARYLGRPWVERFVSAETLSRWDGRARRRGPLFFFLVFLLPFLPDDLICFVIGLSPLPFLPMVSIAAVGRLPGMVAATWLGAHATRIPIWGWVLLAVSTLALASVVLAKSQSLEDATYQVIRRMLRRLRPTRPRKPSEP